MWGENCKRIKDENEKIVGSVPNNRVPEIGNFLEAYFIMQDRHRGRWMVSTEISESFKLMEQFKKKIGFLKFPEVSVENIRRLRCLSCTVE
jgi:hypothetical protein